MTRFSNIIEHECVFQFSLQIKCEIIRILRRLERDMIKSVYWSSRKVPIMLVIFNATLIFSTVFKKILSYWISRKPFQWELSCSMWIDRRTHMDKPYCCFLQFFLCLHPNGVCERCPVCSMLSTVVSPSIMLELSILPAPTNYNKYTVSFEVVTVVLMKTPVFWGMMPCRLLHRCQSLGGVFCLHLQDSPEDWNLQVLFCLQLVLC